MLAKVNFREEIWAATLALGCLASCQSGRAADSAERVTRYEEMLAEEIGVEVELQCPPMINHTFQYCTAVVPQQEDLAFPVRVISRDNELDYSTENWVSGRRMNELGTHTLREKYDIEVDSVSCPPISHMPDGATVRCEAKAEGVEIPLEVGMVVKVRKLEFRPAGGVVFGKEAAEAAHVALLEDGINADVTCARRVIVSVPGKRFECDARMPDNTRSKIHFLITDARGTLELGTRPPEAGSVPG